NQMAVRRFQNAVGPDLISNGETLTIYTPTTNFYTVGPCPATMAEFAAIPDAQLANTGWQTKILFSLASDKILDLLTTDQEVAPPAQQVQLNGQPAILISSVSEPDEYGSWKMWIATG